MQKALLTSLILASGCFSATAGVRGTAAVDQHGSPDLLAVGTLGVGYAIDQSSAVNLEVDVGSSLGAPLLIGESLSYTRLGPTQGWRAGLGWNTAPLSANGNTGLRFFGEYLIPFSSKTVGPSPSSCLNDKGCFDDLFPSTKHSSYWTVGIGPELFVDIDDENTTRLGIGARVAWFGFLGWE